MLTDILFPPRCPGCGEIIRFANRFSYYEGERAEGAYLHKKCKKALLRNDAFYCRRCGTPLEEGEDLCSRCATESRAFDEGRSVFVYEGAAKKALMDIKYHGQSEYCEYFAFAANEMLGEWIRSKGIDVLIPVPVHPKRQKERGYNQAEKLAGQLSSFCGIPVRSDVLVRTKNTKALKELGPEERRKSLQEAFEIRTPLPAGSTVLIVDDIFTTGATMDACARRLKPEGGAARVYCLSICAAAGSRI